MRQSERGIIRSPCEDEHRQVESAVVADTRKEQIGQSCTSFLRHILMQVHARSGTNELQTRAEYSRGTGKSCTRKRVRYASFTRESQCRINYGSGGSPEPGPLNSGGLIISQAEGADKKGNDFELKCAHS